MEPDDNGDGNAARHSTTTAPAAGHPGRGRTVITSPMIELIRMRPMVQVHLAPRGGACCSLAFGQLRSCPQYLPGGRPPGTPRVALSPVTVARRRPGTGPEPPRGPLAGDGCPPLAWFPERPPTVSGAAAGLVLGVTAGESHSSHTGTEGRPRSALAWSVSS